MNVSPAILTLANFGRILARSAFATPSVQNPVYTHKAMQKIAQLIALNLFFATSTFCLCQSTHESSGDSVTATGILLVDDWRCEEWPPDVPKDSMMCPEGASQWGLITESKQYTLIGMKSELAKYERRRVTVTGTVIAAKGDSSLDELKVQSIVSSEANPNQVRALIEELRLHPWAEPMNVANPTSWQFQFTPQMIKILQAGTAAQEVLLEYIRDPQIKDQIIILLGGVGNERAVAPIIDAMATSSEAHGNLYAHKVNLAANLALTNLTVSDVIWHHGGGMMIDACPDDPKSCWSEWWSAHSDTFEVSHTPKRRYSNYPNYGIYQAPGTYSSERFIQNSKDNSRLPH